MKVYQKEHYILIVVDNVIDGISTEMLSDLSVSNKNSALVAVDNLNQVRIYDPKGLINYDNFDTLFDKEI
jgi:hypothetical protein